MQNSYTCKVSIINVTFIAYGLPKLPLTINLPFVRLVPFENKNYLEAWDCLHALPSNERLYDSKVQKALALCQKHLPKDLETSYKKG